MRRLVGLRAMPYGAFRASSLRLTSLVDCPPATGDFIDAAAAFEARAPTPPALVAEFKALGRCHGRAEMLVRRANWRSISCSSVIVGGSPNGLPCRISGRSTASS